MLKALAATQDNPSSKYVDANSQEESTSQEEHSPLAKNQQTPSSILAESNGQEQISPKAHPGKEALKWLAVVDMAKRLEGTKQDCTVSGIEKEIYDSSFNEKLNEGLVPVDADEHPPDNLIRFTTSQTALILDVMLLLNVTIGSFIAPAIFMWNGSEIDLEWVPGGAATLVIDILLDVLYAVDLLLRFNRSYMHPVRRVEVVNPQKIKKNLTGCVVYYLEWASVFATTAALISKKPLPIMLLKTVRMTHIIDLPSSLWWLEQQAIVRLARPLFGLLMGSHWVACLFTSVGNYWAFIPEYESTDMGGPVTLYTLAFIEALYVLTGALDNPVGAGDALRNEQFVLLLFIGISVPIGCVLVALIIAVIMREISMATALDSTHDEKRAFIERALANLNISPTLQRRIFSQHRFQQMSHDYEAFDSLFNKSGISGPLSCALKVYLYRESVLNSPFFENKSHDYILEVVKVLEDRVFLPGDYITRRGEVGAEMFFVGRGELSVLVPNPDDPSDLEVAILVNTMHRGSYFGEVALVKESLRTAWIMSDSYAIVSCLTRDNVEKIWPFFPNERAELQRQVEQVMQRDRARSELQRQTNAANRRDSNTSEMSNHICLVNEDDDSRDEGLTPNGKLKLKVVVSHATDLHDKDFFGKSDPCCTVEIVNGSSTYKIRTPVIKETLNPVWDFTGFFSDYTPGCDLLFKVWDEDDGSYQILGEVTLLSANFLPFGCEEVTLGLLDKGKPAGSLIVTVKPTDSGNRQAYDELHRGRGAVIPKASNPTVTKKNLRESKQVVPANHKKELGYEGDSMNYLETLCDQLLTGQHYLQSLSKELLDRQFALEQLVDATKKGDDAPRKKTFLELHDSEHATHKKKKKAVKTGTRPSLLSNDSSIEQTRESPQNVV